MKKSHILAIVILAIAVGIIVSTAGDASQYVTFDTAFTMAENGNTSKVHVVGELKKDASNQVVGIEYDPAKNPNYIAFTLVDNNKEEHKVICSNPPASMRDFVKSEKVVIIGRADGNQFVANKILMKCPSKYEENQMQASSI
ncbi:cytochrome c maturation protein CcmE [Rapidithrix thailandica]|uniref:Cytochrome c maturation protein CcmE n=1 Tax=Rapidithrix thailandica TaxID=413964 RepID=A0AAW9S8A0_9BACT